MKGFRYIAVLALCAMFAMGAKAQPRLQTPEYYLGVHGGVTASSVLFNPSVAYMTPITDACVLGGWANGSDTGEKTYHNLHYIELPILMHLNFGSDICRWIFNFGPQIGYCVWDESKTIDHPFDWGLAAGTGFYIQTPKAGIYELEVRFNFSFGGVYGTGVTDKYNMASPMDLSVNLGWYFPIRKRVKSEKLKVESGKLKD